MVRSKLDTLSEDCNTIITVQKGDMDMGSRQRQRRFSCPTAVIPPLLLNPTALDTVKEDDVLVHSPSVDLSLPRSKQKRKSFSASSGKQVSVCTPYAT